MRLKNLVIKLFFSNLLFLVFINGYSQEDSPEKFTTGADFYSSYIFRGTKYGDGPVVQPVIKFVSGSFTAGGWGSFDFHNYQEADIFFSFALPAGFSIGMTDYYYPGLNYFDFTKATGSHAFEINSGFSKGGLSLGVNYILNKAGSAGSEGNDIYLEAKYSFESFYILAGAGNGWYSTDFSNGSDKFTICNLGLGTSRTIKVTDSFNIPVNGQVILNPDRKQMYIVVGFTLQ
jgi:hypothetical protein